MTNQNKIEELKKGCGKCSISPELIRLRPNANIDKYSCNENHLCPLCRAELLGRQEAIKEELEFLKDELEFMKQIRNWSEAYNFWAPDKVRIALTLRVFQDRIKQLKQRLA